MPMLETCSQNCPFHTFWSINPMVFCPLLKISLGSLYLKILDLAKRFVADAPKKKV